MTSSNQVSESECRHAHVFEVRPRKDKRGVDLISDVLPFGRLWFSDQLHNIKNRTMENRTIVRLSLCPLLNLVESEGGRSHLRLRRSDRRAEGRKAS